MNTYQEDEDHHINSNSKLGKLILRVNDMQKKPLLDNSLSEVLDVFLQRLRQSEDFLRNGIFQINFAEAALLLQSSAFIYCKKVDLLWESINQCQKRMIAFDSEENKVELQRLEEREKKYKRRRKIVEITNIDECHSDIENFNIDWDEMYEFQHLSSERDSRLFSGWHKKMVINWDLQPISKECGTFVEKYSHFRSTTNAIYDRDHDDEFVVHTTKLESAIALEDIFLKQRPTFDRFSFEVYTELYLVPNFLQYHQLKYDDLEKYKEKFENLVSSYRDRLLVVNNKGNKSIKPPSPELRQNSNSKMRRISITSTIVSKLSRTDFDQVYRQECQVNLLRLSVDDVSRLCRLSVDEVRSYCTPQPLKQDSNVENFQEIPSADNKVTIDAEDISCTAIQEENDEGIIDCIEDVASSNVLQSIPDHTNNDDISDLVVDETLDNSNLNLTDEGKDALVVPEEKCRISKRKRDVLPEENNGLNDTGIIDHNGVLKKRCRLSKAALKKLATGITVDLKAFSLFFAAHYNAEEGEGDVEIPEFDVNDPIDSSSRIDPDEGIRLSQGAASRLCTQDSGYESRFHEDDYVELGLPSPGTPLTPIDTDEPVEISNDPGRSNEPEVLSVPVATDSGVETGNVVAADLPDGEKPLHERVYEWKQHMSEILKNSTSKDFDIHEYGSNIMQCLDTGRPKKFGEIVNGKSSAEVTRYFISALQLANTCNVEIVGAQSGQLSNDTFGLKLLTTDCYYERLKSYVAPSEADYRERLETARKLNQRRAQPGGSGMGHKRPRYE